MNSTDLHFNGFLTRDKWLEWYKTQLTEEMAGPSASSQRSLELVIEYRADRSFELISESLVFREKFFMLSEALQKEVLRYVRADNPIEHIEEFISLALRLESEKDICETLSQGYPLETHLRPLMHFVSDDFDTALFDFRICYPESSRSLCHGIVLSLALLYDELLVESVLQKWTSGKCAGDVSDFADVVEYISSNDELLNYPIDWLVNVIRGTDR